MVNKDRLVSSTIIILRSLLAKNLHYNEIIRQTSTDRTLVDNAIDALERGQLIMELKMSKRERKQQRIHSQAKVMQITDLGRELIDLFDGLERFKRAYFELEKPVTEYFDNWREKTRRRFGEWQRDDAAVRMRNNILREQGFTAEDLEFYDETDNATTQVLGTFLSNVLEIIIVRCALRLYKFDLNNIAKDILNNIIVNAVSFRLSVETEEMDRIYSLSSRGMNKEVEDYINIYHDFDERLIDDMQVQQYIPAVIYKEVKNAILAYLSLLKAPKNSVDDIYRSIKSNFEKSKPPSISLTKEERLLRDQLLSMTKPTKEQKKIEEEWLLKLPKRVKCLLDAYETYMSRSN